MSQYEDAASINELAKKSQSCFKCIYPNKLTTTRESPHAATKTQHSQKENKLLIVNNFYKTDELGSKDSMIFASPTALEPTSGLAQTSYLNGCAERERQVGKRQEDEAQPS